MSYLLVVGVTVAIYVILTISLNIVVGYAGQPNLGQGAFFGIGGYMAAVLMTSYHASFWLALLVAMVSSGLCGMILGIMSLRLRADYLAITTIGINFVTVAAFQTIPFFGGAVGIYAIPPPSIGTYQFDNTAFFSLGVALVIATAVLSLYLRHAWFGSSLLALKDDEQAAASIGIRVPAYKVGAFVISTALAGIAGALYASFLSVVTPTSFGFSESVVILAMLVFGGLGTVAGAIAGGVILGVLPEAFRFVSDYRLLTFGAILVFMLRFQPQGLLGPGSWLRTNLRPSVVTHQLSRRRAPGGSDTAVSR